MLTKLKYVGVSIEDLLQIYSLFIRSRAEFCGVSFHSSLTIEQTRKLENIQRTCLKIILQENYVNYQAACEMTGFLTLSQRRENRTLTFARRCLQSEEMARFFPLTPDLRILELREREKFQVNFAHGEAYRKSAIPYCQRKLNEFTHMRKAQNQQRESEWEEWMEGLEARLRRRREDRADRGEGEGE